MLTTSHVESLALKAKLLRGFADAPGDTPVQESSERNCLCARACAGAPSVMPLPTLFGPFPSPGPSHPAGQDEPVPSTVDPDLHFRLPRR
jgi:hypothetical protein